MQQNAIRTIIKLLTLWVPVVVFGACETDITRTRSGAEEVSADGPQHQDAAFDGQTEASQDTCRFVRYDWRGNQISVGSYHGYVYAEPEKMAPSGQVVDFEWGERNMVTDDLVRHTCELDWDILLQVSSPYGAYTLETYVESLPALVLRSAADSYAKSGIVLRLLDRVSGSVVAAAPVTIEDRLAPDQFRYCRYGPGEYAKPEKGKDGHCVGDGDDLH